METFFFGSMACLKGINTNKKLSGKVGIHLFLCLFAGSVIDS